MHNIGTIPQAFCDSSFNNFNKIVFSTRKDSSVCEIFSERKNKWLRAKLCVSITMQSLPLF